MNHKEKSTPGNRSEHCSQRVREFLFDQESADNHSADGSTRFDEHFADCETCQRLLDKATVDTAWWSEAKSLLTPDEWDGHGHQSSTLTPILVSDDSRELDSDARASMRRQVDDDHSQRTRQIIGLLDPTDDPQMIGRFGGYEIVGVVGQGGMGVVLKGFESSLNRYVAIKVLAPHLASSGAARQRFSREAQAAAAVLHENVIAIYRVAESNGLPFLVMPYVAGPSLQKRLDSDGQLPTLAVLRIGQQIAAGLAAAHQLGLVHRDIKPANILLERGVERVAITDFGLARACDDASLTHTGMIAGTPQFMSPEQARGEPIDGRSDLFSLGSLLYTCITGRPPFRGDTSYGILMKTANDRPRPMRDLSPETPLWLVKLIERLHEKVPAARNASAKEVAKLLGECIAHLQQPDSRPLPEELSLAMLEAKAEPNSHATKPDTPYSRRNNSASMLIGGIAICLLFVAGLTFLIFFTEVLSDSSRPHSAHDSPHPTQSEAVRSPHPGSLNSDVGLSSKASKAEAGAGSIEVESDWRQLEQEFNTLDSELKDFVERTKDVPGASANN